MKRKPYPAYKPSGVEWLGEIPEHWEVMPFKRIAEICNGQDYKEFEEIDGAYPVIGSGGEFARASAIMFNGESVLLGRKGTIDKPLYINGPFWVVDTMFYTRIYPRAFPKFVYYSSLIIQFEMYSTNTALPSMTGENLSSHIIATPRYSEQRAIAAFLDRETSRIDELIARKQRQIELLQEKRSALISHVVTKGLDPNVKMKDSGIEWLGEIPEHWEIVPLKFLVSVVSKGTTPTTMGMDFVDSGIRFIKAENITADGIDNNPAIYIDELTNQALQRSILRANDVLMVIAGATAGKVAVVEKNNLPANTNQAVAFIRLLDESIARFLYHWLSGNCIQNLIKLNAVQSAQPNLSMENIKNFIIPLPPDDEIQSIELYADKALGECNVMIKKVKLSVNYLREYRTALISAAVTGKIDVHQETYA